MGIIVNELARNLDGRYRPLFCRGARVTENCRSVRRSLCRTIVPGTLPFKLSLLHGVLRNDVSLYILDKVNHAA